MQKSGTLTGCNPLGIARAKITPPLKNNQIDLDALKVERDENDQRKEPTISEKVALAEAIEARIKGPNGTRQGQRTDLGTSGNISPSDDAGRTKDIAAAKAGLGSGKTLEAAQRVIERNIPELVEAMDQGRISHWQGVMD